MFSSLRMLSLLYSLCYLLDYAGLDLPPILTPQRFGSEAIRYTGSDEPDGQWDGDTYTMPGLGIELALPEGFHPQKHARDFYVTNEDASISIYLQIYKPFLDTLTQLSVDMVPDYIQEAMETSKSFPVVGEVEETGLAGYVFHVLPTIQSRYGTESANYFYFKQAQESIFTINVLFPAGLYGDPQQEDRVNALLESMLRRCPSDASRIVGQWEEDGYAIERMGIKIRIPRGMRMGTEADFKVIEEPVQWRFYNFALLQDPVPDGYDFPAFVLVDLLWPPRKNAKVLLETMRTNMYETYHDVGEVETMSISGFDFAALRMRMEANGQSSEGLILLLVEDGVALQLSCSHYFADEADLISFLESIIVPLER